MLLHLSSGMEFAGQGASGILNKLRYFDSFPIEIQKLSLNDQQVKGHLCAKGVPEARELWADQPTPVELV